MCSGRLARGLEETLDKDNTSKKFYACYQDVLLHCALSGSLCHGILHRP